MYYWWWVGRWNIVHACVTFCVCVCMPVTSPYYNLNLMTLYATTRVWLRLHTWTLRLYVYPLPPYTRLVIYRILRVCRSAALVLPATPAFPRSIAAFPRYHTNVERSLPSSRLVDSTLRCVDLLCHLTHRLRSCRHARGSRRCRLYLCTTFIYTHCPLTYVALLLRVLLCVATLFPAFIDSYRIAPSSLPLPPFTVPYHLCLPYVLCGCTFVRTCRVFRCSVRCWRSWTPFRVVPTTTLPSFDYLICLLVDAVRWFYITLPLLPPLRCWSLDGFVGFGRFCCVLCCCVLIIPVLFGTFFVLGSFVTCLLLHYTRTLLPTLGLLLLGSLFGITVYYYCVVDYLPATGPSDCVVVLYFTCLVDCYIHHLPCIIHCSYNLYLCPLYLVNSYPQHRYYYPQRLFICCDYCTVDLVVRSPLLHICLYPLPLLFRFLLYRCIYITVAPPLLSISFSLLD